jgi:hypothetical protein
MFYVLYGFYGGLQPWLFWKLLDQGRNPYCKSWKMFLFAPFDFYSGPYIRFLMAMAFLRGTRRPNRCVGVKCLEHDALEEPAVGEPASDPSEILSDTVLPRQLFDLDNVPHFQEVLGHCKAGSFCAGKWKKAGP